MEPRRILLTGATGFVGQAVQPALAAAGWEVRCLTRNIELARARSPGLAWVQGDVADKAASTRALEGCDAALYLVHSIGEGADFQRREVASAERFAGAAAAAGVRRMVYLGGVAPRGEPSPHLRSRLAVGEALRAGLRETIELRASMIIGHGSLSWEIVRDLAARLPVMVLPTWLESCTQPVAIDDVIVALISALRLDVGTRRVFDIPGPEVLSGRQILEETAKVMGRRPAWMLGVPLLSPHLSSLWVRAVTRADWAVARQIVIGLAEDLIASDDVFWRLIGHPSRIRFAEAAQRALEAERRSKRRVTGPWGAIERILQSLMGDARRASRPTRRPIPGYRGG